FDVLTAALEEPSDDVLADYFEENKETLEAGGIKKDGVRFVNVRHILIKVDGGIEAEDGTITFSDEALAAEGYAEAEAILAQWLENPTEENFAALAKEYTEDSNGEAGGLYTDVYPGMMVTTFNDWCFDESRQKGDYGIVETRFGYHIMFLSDFGEELWLADTRDAYMSQKQSEILQELLAEYQMEVNYSKIALAFVDLS
ncbi:MAG: peptidylprolyl isomerase, partial [Oscillospiraceae bacterium]|nr:peptidylprolyl isomerase [Oscillospiraceae bacterium]